MPAEREARWQLRLLFAIDAADQDGACAVLGQALAGLDGLRLLGEPAVRPRHRDAADRIWIAETRPDLTGLQEIDPDDAKTRCRFVTGFIPGDVTWAIPRRTEQEAAYEWPPGIWHRQHGDDDVLLHPAIRAVMIFCTAADSPAATAPTAHGLSGSVSTWTCLLKNPRASRTVAMRASL